MTDQPAPLEIKSLAKLKYLFLAEFADGTVLQQTQEDRSALKADKSAFYDVVQRLHEVVIFTLEGEGHTYQVDLRDGRFYVDARPFSVFIEDEDHIEAQHISPRRLVFFRRRQHHFVVGGADDGKEIGQNVRYCIGWQATAHLPGGRERKIQARIAVD